MVITIHRKQLHPLTQTPLQITADVLKYDTVFEIESSHSHYNPARQLKHMTMK